MLLLCGYIHTLIQTGKIVLTNTYTICNSYTMVISAKPWRSLRSYTLCRTLIPPLNPRNARSALFRQTTRPKLSLVTSGQPLGTQRLRSGTTVMYPRKYWADAISRRRPSPRTEWIPATLAPFSIYFWWLWYMRSGITHRLHSTPQWLHRYSRLTHRRLHIALKSFKLLHHALICIYCNRSGEFKVKIIANTYILLGAVHDYMFFNIIWNKYIN